MVTPVLDLPFQYIRDRRDRIGSGTTECPWEVRIAADLLMKEVQLITKFREFSEGVI